MMNENTAIQVQSCFPEKKKKRKFILQTEMMGFDTSHCDV